MKSEEQKNVEVPETKDTSNGDMDLSDLYPGRRQRETPRSWLSKIFLVDSQEEVEKTQCELNVYKCVNESPIVKLMLAALKSSGCEVDLSRHISCEVCDKKVTGGYDPQCNQIVICQNTARNISRVQSALTHEMVHMFDYCRHKLDLNNLDHLACTEIRAANMCHCSFFGAYSQGMTSFTNFKQTHRDCVINKAIKSVLAVQNVSEDTAIAAVMRVFDKCYNDLEPIGRRIRRNSEDMQKAYDEGTLYGYVD